VLPQSARTGDLNEALKRVRGDAARVIDARLLIVCGVRSRSVLLMGAGVMLRTLFAFRHVDADSIRPMC